MSEEIVPFKVEVSDEVLEDLQQRLARTRFPQQIDGTEWDYGVEGGYVQDLVAYWRDGFDWRKQEALLNSFPQFTTRIGDQNIHFMHVRSKHEDAIPLLISHGWPGTVVEFLDVIGPLTDPEAHGGRAEDAFHVVAPSLPGYGFSEFTKSTGYDAQVMAENFIELMARLGYSKYVAQGGDWGAIITNSIGVLDAEHLHGIHLNMPLALPPPDGPALSEKEQADMADYAHFEQQETGYQKIQGTKPQTLGHALNDSPAGLCAWIAEKFRTWTDCDGVIENAVSRDRLLTNIMVYWVTETITSSARMYYETFKSGRVGIIGNKVEVPTGVARFPKEIMRFPRAWVENHYDVVHWTEMPKGGHFAAMEQPELFVEDVRKCCGRFR